MLANKYNDDNYSKMSIYDVGATYYDWNNIAIGIIHQLLEDTNSNIVISSDWRTSINLSELNRVIDKIKVKKY